MAMPTLPEKFCREFCTKFEITTVYDLRDKPQPAIRAYFDQHYPKGMDPDREQAWKMLIGVMDRAYIVLGSADK